jgi:hypothetical protein
MAIIGNKQKKLIYISVLSAMIKIECTPIRRFFFERSTQIRDQEKTKVYCKYKADMVAWLVSNSYRTEAVHQSEDCVQRF